MSKEDLPEDPARDTVVRQMRDAIIDNDLQLLATVNRRIELVRRLRAYKRSHDMAFVDTAREQWMHTYLAGANKGPLSETGFARIYDEVLDLTKRETADDLAAGQ